MGGIILRQGKKLILVERERRGNKGRERGKRQREEIEISTRAAHVLQ